ncbi:OsmC family protein [Agromyces sp. H66]|uniref:OsmC family protein n=1 Tax=Agromyces sp. H66 TaxID=2529859 RepID=UPI0010AA4ED2|nr:OsmC family protein [Agromyces sp. H66]
MAAAPSTYRVSAASTSGGSAVATAASTTIPFDASWGRDEPSGLPGPAELLASAFTACMLKNLERAGALLGFTYESAEVDVVARRQDAPPMFVELRYELRVTTSETQHRVDLVHQNLRKFGTVYNTLAAVCDVDGMVVAVAPSGG